MLDKTSISAPAVQDNVDLLRRVQVAAEMIESWGSELGWLLGQFAPDNDAPNKIWDAAASAASVVEIATCDIQCVIEDLDAVVT